MTAAAVAALVLAACEGGTQPAPVATTAEPAAGIAQTGAPHAVLADSIAVRVLDQRGDPSPGVIVNFSVTGGGGSVSPAQVITGPDGIARAAWTLGAPGPQSARASIPALAANVDFAATATAPPPAQVVKEGDGVTAVVMKPGVKFTVLVKDAAGNPVEGAVVSWATTQGQLDAVNYTGADGRASTWYTPGAVAGPQTVTATVQGLPPVTFTVNAQADVPYFLRKVAGDLQAPTWNQPLADSLRVRVTDPYGNPSPGITVNWSIENPAGPATGSVSPATSVTDAQGYASARWTLGSLYRRVRVSALVPEGLVFFSLNVQPGAPTKIVAASPTSVFSSNLGAPLPDSLQVRVYDVHEVPVPGAQVTWQVTNGGGSTHPPVSATGADGIARTSWTIGANYATNVLLAYAAGTDTVTFRVVTSSVVYVFVAPSSATITVGGTVQLTARPTDGRLRDLPGHVVTWSTSNPAVATVSSTGLVTGVGPGTATITAECEGSQGTSTITVNP